MKLKENLVLRQVADTWVVLALGDASVNLNGMLKLNESGVFLWKMLEKGCDRSDLIAALTSEYAVDTAVASADVDAFLSHLRNIGCLID